MLDQLIRHGKKSGFLALNDLFVQFCGLLKTPMSPSFKQSNLHGELNRVCYLIDFLKSTFDIQYLLVYKLTFYDLKISPKKFLPDLYSSHSDRAGLVSLDLSSN